MYQSLILDTGEVVSGSYCSDVGELIQESLSLWFEDDIPVAMVIKDEATAEVMAYLLPVSLVTVGGTIGGYVNVALRDGGLWQTETVFVERGAGETEARVVVNLPAKEFPIAEYRGLPVIED